MGREASNLSTANWARVPRLGLSTPEIICEMAFGIIRPFSLSTAGMEGEGDHEPLCTFFWGHI